MQEKSIIVQHQLTRIPARLGGLWTLEYRVQ